MNDRVEVALRVGADGVHLGKTDMAWGDARALAGHALLIGGTVNAVADAEAAVAARVLDYVGVSPFRFTPTKQNLAPVLSAQDWTAILNTLGPLPAYGIGGIEAADLAVLRGLGLRGVAVCGGLCRDGTVAHAIRRYADGWRDHDGTKKEHSNDADRTP